MCDGGVLLAMWGRCLCCLEISATERACYKRHGSDGDCV